MFRKSLLLVGILVLAVVWGFGFPIFLAQWKARGTFGWFVFLYAYYSVWFCAFWIVALAVLGLYWRSPTVGRVPSRARRWITGYLVFYAYAYAVFAFAFKYVQISDSDRNAFNVATMDIGTAVYFSIVTAATVGYGDIYPKSWEARTAVCAEIGMNLVFAVLLFSVLASGLPGAVAALPSEKESTTT